MTDIATRIAAAVGAAASEIVGPIEVDTARLFGQFNNVGWATALYNVRALTATGQPGDPIILAVPDGQFSLILSADPDWRFYAEFAASWPQDRRLRWTSLLGGADQVGGQIDPMGVDQWYFATPAFGSDGEVVIDITAEAATDAPDELQLGLLRFYLFR